MDNKEMLTEIKSVMEDMQRKYDEGKEAEGDRLNNIAIDLEQKMEKLELASKRSSYDDIQGKAAEHVEEFKSYLGTPAMNYKASEFTTLDQASAGVLIPATVMSQILAKRQQLNAMRQLCGSLTLGGQATEYKFGRETEGATATWGTGEGQERAKTQVGAFDAHTIGLHSMHVRPSMTVEALADIPNIEAWLALQTGRALANTENDGFLKGTGVNQPLGMLNYVDAANGLSIKSVNTDNAELSYDDIINLVSTIHQSYVPGSSILMNRKTLFQLRKDKSQSGRYLSDGENGATNAGIQAFSNIMGIPVVLDDAMPTTDTPGETSILFGNFKEAYLIIDRAGVRALRDEITDFARVQFLQEYRVGAGLFDENAVLALKNV